MGLLFTLIAYLLVTLARLIGPGGIRTVAAESLAVKHLCVADCRFLEKSAIRHT
jgi:hypothetical protein